MPPDEHTISFSCTINTKGHRLSPHLRKIHFFIIDSFCLYYVIHPFSTDTMVLYDICCALLRVFLLTTNWQLSLNDFASTLLHHHDLNIMPFSYWMKKLFFLNIQPFSMTWKKIHGDNTIVLRFSTLIRSTMHPYIANTIRFANTQIFSQF